MANTLLTNDIISKTALMEFKNNLVMARTVNRQYQKDFDPTTGSTIRVRKPTRYTVRNGATAAVQDIQQRQDTFTVGTQQGVDMAVSSAQLALQLDDFNREIIRPAMLQLANAVDSSLYQSAIPAVYNVVGTAGTAPNSFATINSAGALLTSYGTPLDDRYLMMSPNDGAALQSALYNTFNTSFNTDIILKGTMGELAGFQCYQVQNVTRPILLTGGVIGTPLVNGAAQSGATLNVDGLTAAITVKAGAKFTIANVFAVNQLDLNPLTNLQEFVVTADTVVSGGGTAALPIAPAIVLTGPYQNVSVGPADNAAMTFITTQHTMNLAYYSEAFSLAMIRLPDEQNNGTWRKTMVDSDANVAIRMTRQYDFDNDQDRIRFDIYYGVKCWGEYGAIVMGS